MKAKKTTKSIGSVLFLLLGCMPWVFILSYFLQQQTIRHRIKEKLEATFRLHTVRVPQQEVYWVKPGKEIWVNERMFDIKTMTTENGITTFTGLYDNEETQLKKQFNEGWGKQCEDDNQTLARFFTTWLADISDQAGSPVIHRAGTISFPCFLVSHLPRPCYKIPTPPPQAC